MDEVGRPMNRKRINQARIKATEVNRAPGSILHRVAVGEERIIVECDGNPIAIIAPYEVGRAQAEQFLEDLTRELQPQAEQKSLTEEQVVKDVRKARKALRRKTKGKAAK